MTVSWPVAHADARSQESDAAGEMPVFGRSRHLLIEMAYRRDRYFALAQFLSHLHKDRAFQASSPKTSGRLTPALFYAGGRKRLVSMHDVRYRPGLAQTTAERGALLHPIGLSLRLADDLARGEWHMASGPPTRGSTEAGYMPLALALALPTGISDEPTHSAVAAMARYVAADLTHDHPDLGRDGPVCPYAAGAVRRDLVRIGSASLDRLDGGALRSAVGDLRAVFEALAAATAPCDRLYCAAILVLPHLPSGGAALVEQVQREAKPAFVRDGLMIGEFYPGCPRPGLHSARFRPFDAPVAALAVRMMTAYDAPFLAGHPDFMASYTRFFGVLRQPAEPRGSA